MLDVPVFKGIATALVTPFCKDGIDYAHLAEIIEFQLTHGADALVVCGTTGESPVLTTDEKKELFDFAVRQTRHRVPVIAGTGGSDVKTACLLSEYACGAGVSALLVVTPYYNKTTPKGLIRTYEAISSASDKPIIVYNVPSRTGVNVTPEQYAELAEIPRVEAVKEASNDVSKLAEAMSLCHGKLRFYSGSDELLLPFLSLGGDGVISVASNIVPKEMKKLYVSFVSGDIERAAETQSALTPLEKLLFCETNPVPVKTALHYMGLCEKRFRLPLCEMAEENEKLLVNELAKRGLIPGKK